MVRRNKWDSTSRVWTCQARSERDRGVQEVSGEASEELVDKTLVSFAIALVSEVCDGGSPWQNMGKCQVSRDTHGRQQ